MWKMHSMPPKMETSNLSTHYCKRCNIRLRKPTPTRHTAHPRHTPTTTTRRFAEHKILLLISGLGCTRELELQRLVTSRKPNKIAKVFTKKTIKWSDCIVVITGTFKFTATLTSGYSFNWKMLAAWICSRWINRSCRLFNRYKNLLPQPADSLTLLVSCLHPSVVAM